ncbi:FHA domain-containing protein DDL [Glycine soja]|nr:FHA domain-containing protein DDL [Glycine max]
MGRHSSSNHSPSSSRRHRSHRSSVSPPLRDKHEHSGCSTAKPVRYGSPDSPLRSPSPSLRTKRLKKGQSEREREPRENERNHGDGSRGRGSEREAGERREKKRTENDESNGRSNKSEKRTEMENDDGGGRSNKSLRSRHERSPERDRNGRSRHRSQSPPRHHASAADAKPRDEMTNAREAEQMDDEDDSIRKMKAAEEALEEKQKQKPSFELSGKLAGETNRVRGVTLLFNEPPEARKPDIKWRLYVFKAGEVLNEPLYIHRQSCYLFGRERRVADIPTDHPSCSKQHAVIQFRQVEKEQPDGTLLKQDSPIEPQRYYELKEKDTIKFGNSSREYVLLHENSIGQ